MVQMFEPFQDWNPHFFGTVSLSWFVMKSISKTYSFNLFWSKPLRKIFLEDIFQFLQVFGINSDSIMIFKNMCEFFREKSQIVILSTFDQDNSRWSKVLKTTIWDFSLKNSHIFLGIIHLDCKVFKFKRFSSVTKM